MTKIKPKWQHGAMHPDSETKFSVQHLGPIHIFLLKVRGVCAVPPVKII